MAHVNLGSAVRDAGGSHLLDLADWIAAHVDCQIVYVCHFVIDSL